MPVRGLCDARLAQAGAREELLPALRVPSRRGPVLMNKRVEKAGEIGCGCLLVPLTLYLFLIWASGGVTWILQITR